MKTQLSILAAVLMTAVLVMTGCPNGGDDDGEESPEVNITITPSANGTVKADPPSAKEGDTVTLTITPTEGYELQTIAVTDAASATVRVSGNGPTRTFQMPAGKVTVTAVFKLVHTVTIPTFGNGSVSANPNKGIEGTQITLTISANPGYELDGNITVSPSSVTLTEVANDPNQRRFSMPDEPVTVTAAFKESSYTITANETPGGTYTVSPTEPQRMGAIITLTLGTANAGFTFSSWAISPDVELTEVTPGSVWTFPMPAGNVIINAGFANDYTGTDNLARGKPASSSSVNTYAPTRLSNLAFDGSRYSGRPAANVTHWQAHEGNDGNWIAVDLGTVYNIKYVYINWGIGTESDLPWDGMPSCAIQVAISQPSNFIAGNSTVGNVGNEGWTTVKTASGLSEAETYWAYLFELDNVVQARFVRLRQEGSNPSWPRVSSFEVYNQLPPEGLPYLTPPPPPPNLTDEGEGFEEGAAGQTFAANGNGYITAVTRATVVATFDGDVKAEGEKSGKMVYTFNATGNDPKSARFGRNNYPAMDLSDGNDSGFTKITFKARSQYADRFQIVLRSGSTADRTAEFTVTAADTWQDISIPLSSFSGTSAQRNNVAYVAFLATNAQINESPVTLNTEGTLWIDEIKVE